MRWELHFKTTGVLLMVQLGQFLDLENNRWVLYNGHKRVHAINFRSIAAPNRLIANLFGPERRRHDSGMLAESELLTDLQRHSFSPLGRPLCFYGDPAYPLNVDLQGPFKGARITPIQNEYNTKMSRVRCSVEWVFGDIVNYLAFMDFKKNLKSRLNAVEKMYLVRPASTLAFFFCLG